MTETQINVATSLKPYRALICFKHSLGRDETRLEIVLLCLKLQGKVLPAKINPVHFQSRNREFFETFLRLLYNPA